MLPVCGTPSDFLPDLLCVLCRTLTPFGFQAEERTLWQAPDTYQLMSPFNQADKIKKPLLLIHGEADNNAGELRGGGHTGTGQGRGHDQVVWRYK